MNTTITVCLCTYKREHLKLTLASLAAQQLPEGVSFNVSIVDNDKDGSGKVWVDQCRAETNLQLHYQIQSEKNISVARNATVAAADGDWLAFLDDDEIAEPDWLAQLLDCAQQYQADVVQGALKVNYPDHTPDWILAGDYFGKHLPPTGTQRQVGSTCNALVKRSALPHPTEPFDKQFGITGGGDTHFFSRIHQAGGLMVSCCEAVVSETVEDNRLNESYLRRRALRVGETYSVIFFQEISSLRKLLVISKASALILVGGLVSLILSPTGKQYSLFYKLKMLQNWGKLRYFMSLNPVEIYK
ncbi:glycosyltransferase [Neiella marina]|uniref:Glycosyltransferase n=1 Tax=Neiella holothuriorum TaxID=2870530 RepID=A0ABS7EGI5_9GAMM|nr:glycosyltransferase family 2 protein [Neiella holothuriorum]MBW8191457.1 glycosyltransferase [Neiella holothuriorum]